MGETIGAALGAGKAVFGVCLGLQGIVEHFGGRLGQLAYPMHGKASLVRAVCGRRRAAVAALPRAAGRGHRRAATTRCSRWRRSCPLPEVTARSDDGVIMAVEHVSLPVAAVQFHPESIMSLGDAVGLRLVRNVVERAPAGSLGAADTRPPSDRQGAGSRVGGLSYRYRPGAETSWRSAATAWMSRSRRMM